MPMSRILFPFVCLLMLAGCASSDSSALFTPYSDEDFRGWEGTGSANLKGQAFVRLPDGRLLTCAGTEISLKPATGYNMEMEEGLDAGKGFPANYNKRAHKFDHKTVCDGSGYFSFENLPPRNWIVMTHIAWQEPSSIMFMSPNDAGGTLIQEILLQSGDNKTVLSNQDLAKDSE
jgi:hypothetical protein